MTLDFNFVTYLIYTHAYDTLRTPTNLDFKIDIPIYARMAINGFRQPWGFIGLENILIKFIFGETHYL